MFLPLKNSRDRSRVPCTADSAKTAEQGDADALQKMFYDE
jgi:hypothetical protein